MYRLRDLGKRIRRSEEMKSKSKFILLAAIVVGGCLTMIVGCNRGSQRAAKKIEERATKTIEKYADDVMEGRRSMSPKRPIQKERCTACDGRGQVFDGYQWWVCGRCNGSGTVYINL